MFLGDNSGSSHPFVASCLKRGAFLAGLASCLKRGAFLAGPSFQYCPRANCTLFPIVAVASQDLPWRCSKQDCQCRSFAMIFCNDMILTVFCIYHCLFLDRFSRRLDRLETQLEKLRGGRGCSMWRGTSPQNVAGHVIPLLLYQSWNFLVEWV